MCSPSAPRQSNTRNQQDDLRILLSRDAYDDRFTGGRRRGIGSVGAEGGGFSTGRGQQGGGQDLQEFFDRIRIRGGLQVG